MTRKTREYREGWKACEAGAERTHNPYSSQMPVFRDPAASPLLELAAKALEWADGFEARGEKGFDVSHLPRKPCSDAFA